MHIQEMHVGEEYQAQVPLGPNPQSDREDSHLGFETRLLWQPGHLSERVVEKFEQSYSKTLALHAPLTRTPDDEEVSKVKIT